MHLANDIISIDVAEHGAELSSLVANGIEYLWQGDARYWGRISPVLFPIVGSVWNGEYRVNGTTYKMSQHGFARDMDFTLVEKTENRVEYELVDTPDTLKAYPYHFRLRISYELKGSSVIVGWKVKNTGDGEMHFQIGAHPAFYWPMLRTFQRSSLEQIDNRMCQTDKRGSFSFGRSEKHTLVCMSIGQKGCVSPHVQTLMSTGVQGRMALSTETFSRDALIFQDHQVQEVTLHDNRGQKYLTLKFDAPLVGLWSPPKKNAPFVCIEPWYGRCDKMDFTGDISEREFMQHLKAGEEFVTSYEIIVE